MAFKNADRFKRKIAMLSPTLQAAIRQAMEQTAKQIVEAMKKLVPVDRGNLRDSIGWCWGDAPKGAHVLTTLSSAPVGGEHPFRLTIFAGSFRAFYARWVEFGTRAHAPGGYRDAGGRKRNAGARGHPATPAHPFFYPVWRAYKGQLRKNIVKILNAAIRRLVASNG